MRWIASMSYSLRYAIALVVWAVIVLGDIFLRIAFLPILPFVRLRYGYTQKGAQFEINAVEFYTRPLMRMPRLFNHRRRCSANQPPQARPVKHIGNGRI